jgi:hypothetical protein
MPLITADVGASKEAVRQISTKPKIHALAVPIATPSKSSPLFITAKLQLCMLITTLVAASRAVGQCEAYRGIRSATIRCTLVQPAMLAANIFLGF